VRRWPRYTRVPATGGAKLPHIERHPEIVVQAIRGGTTESVHRAVAALAGPDGEIVARWGDPRVTTFWRSSAKPFQAHTWIADGTVGAFGWGPRELAVMSASHEGLDIHASLVRRMLADVGLDEDALRCGGALKARHQCSGNHTGFLAACVRHGWDVAGYPQAGHPAQQAALRMFAACAGLVPARVATGVDGCGIVSYATSLAVAASAYALLPELVPDVSEAMKAHPELVEGPGEFDTVVMSSIPGLVSKCGAEGLGCLSLPGGRGLAVKVVDGASRARVPATVAALRAVLGELPEAVTELGRPPVTNDAGAVVGELIAVAPA